MGNFASTLFSSLLGWLQGAAAWAWGFFAQPDQGGFILWIAQHWLPLTVGLCLACMAIDAVVYLFRWQPHKVWASFFRRLTGQDREDETLIRRKWVHADGSTRVEEVPLSDETPEPPTRDLVAETVEMLYQRPQEDNGRPHGAVLGVPQWQRSAEQPEASPAEAANLGPEIPFASLEPPTVIPGAGLEGTRANSGRVEALTKLGSAVDLEADSGALEAVTELDAGGDSLAEAASAAPEEEPLSRTIIQPVVAMPRPQRPRRRRFYEGEEPLPLRYAPPPASDNATDFHEPYVPQNWRRPSDFSANNEMEGSGL